MEILTFLSLAYEGRGYLLFFAISPSTKYTQGVLI